VRKGLAKIPRRAIGVSYVKTGSAHRCDLNSMGLTLETDPVRYRFDNQRRQGGCLFQYTLYGEGRFEDLGAGVTHGMYPGRGFLVPFPSPTRYWLPEEREWDFIYICFSGDMALHHVQQLIQRYGYVLNLPTDSVPIDILVAMFTRLAEGEMPDEFAASREVYRFLMELYRVCQKPSETAPEDIGRAQALVRAEYGDADLSVERMAQAAGCSRYHFSRRFKACTGLSPHAFLLRTRLRAALELLAQTETPIKQIALAVGFRDYPYFCNVVKRHTHHTPASVRRHKEGFRLSEMLTG